uniref:IS4 family transposase n=1 Tax=Angiostrongylus costaricensis TaxID=334426 RepID=A0A0R3PYJ9_ANGCS
LSRNDAIRCHRSHGGHLQFEESHTYGLTALLCIVMATAVLQRTPSFDITPALTLARIAAMSPSNLIDEIFSCIGRPTVSHAKL